MTSQWGQTADCEIICDIIIFQTLSAQVTIKPNQFEEDQLDRRYDLI